MNKKIFVRVLSVIGVIALAVLGVCTYQKYKEEKKREAELMEMVRLQKEEDARSFYQKLKAGNKVNILILGDSIGASTGASEGHDWESQMKEYLLSEYLGNNKELIQIENQSLGGNDSYAGYVLANVVDPEDDYDLVMICFGHNDDERYFGPCYEAIIRTVKERFPKSSIMAFLESSQQVYTNKIRVIQDVCRNYKIPVIDTIDEFNQSGIAYEDLTVDGVHPNDKGYELYTDAIKKTIDSFVQKNEGFLPDTGICFEECLEYENFRWFGVDSSRVKRESDTEFVINLNLMVGANIGLDYTRFKGKNGVKVLIDNNLITDYVDTYNHDFEQRTILLFVNGAGIQEELRIVFQSKEQADTFNGVAIHWKN